MIEILRDRDASAAAAFGADVSRPVLCYTARQDGKPLCSCTYGIEDGLVAIYELVGRDGGVVVELGDGVLRAVLNSADLFGIRGAVCSNEGLDRLLTGLGFKEESTSDGKKRYFLDLEGYFTEK